MNTIAMDRRLLPQPEAKPRRPKSVRPRFKKDVTAEFAVTSLSQPPAVGGETFAFCPDWDEAMAARYAQEGHPLAMLVRLRLEAARHVEALLAFLDATEGDIDLGADDAEPTLEAIRTAARLCDDHSEDDEDGADHEPWLASPEPLTTYEDEFWFPYRSQDARQDIHQGVTDDRELDESDDEPSLCGVHAHWVPSASGTEDGEQEADDEPSLGSVDGGYDGIGPRSMGQQERWAQGAGIDLEMEHCGREPDDGDDEDCGDDEEHEASGIADVDGLIEQGAPNLRFNTKAHETLGEAIESGKWSWAGV